MTTTNLNNNNLNLINISHSLNNDLDLNHTNVNGNNLNLLYINVRSLRNKLEDFELTILKQNVLTHFIVITETWLYDNEMNHFNIKNYNKLFCNRSTRAGGVAIYVHVTLTANEVYNKEFNGNNILGAFITAPNIVGFHLFGIYRCPNSDVSNFIDILSSIMLNYKNIVYTGDFNLNLKNKNCDSEVFNYVTAVYSTGHFFLNSEDNSYYTRMGRFGVGTIIDHIFTDLLKYSFTLSVCDTHLSDHRYLYLNIQGIDPHIENKLIAKKIIDYKKIPQTQLNSILNAPNFDEFVDNIKQTIQENTKSITRQQKFRSKKPWITKDIIDLIKKQNYFFKLKKKYPLNDYFNIKFLFFRNKVVYTNRASKKSYYSNKFISCKDDPKKFWSITKEIIFNKFTVLSPITLKINESLVSNQTEVACHFNSFFTSIGKCNQVNNDSSTNNIQIQPTFSFYLRKITPKDIKDIVMSLNCSSANGYDNIPLKFFIHFIDLISEKFSLLINHSFNLGQFPDCLKTAKVTPIFKSNERFELTNYRPISVLSSISKIFEKAIQRQLEKFLTENQIIHPNQFGFITNSSTLAACTQLINFVELNIDRGLYVCCVFLDLQKAFDSVHHETLYKKFRQIGIVGKELEIFKSYHTSRKQFVKILESCSGTLEVDNGVAQGSILSTTEFSIFLNDIFKVGLTGKIQLYADDAVVMYSGNNLSEQIERIQSDLVLLHTWLTQNKLKLNVKKSSYIIFDKNKILNDTVPQILVNGIILNRAYNVKYLGLYIDSKLNWNMHIENIKKRISPLLFALRRLSYCLERDALWNIYHAYVMSRITYLIPIWSNTSVRNLNDIQVL